MTTKVKVILGVVAVAVVAAIIIKRQRDKQSKFSEAGGTNCQSLYGSMCKNHHPNAEGIRTCRVCATNETSCNAELCYPKLRL